MYTNTLEIHKGSSFLLHMLIEDTILKTALLNTANALEEHAWQHKQKPPPPTSQK